MEDEEIIELYFKRSENAVRETQSKYGKLLQSVAYKILSSRADAEECENDTYLKAWNTIPPQRPDIFCAYLAKITRNLSLDRYEQIHAEKRGKGQIPLTLDELAECIPDENENVAKSVEGNELTEILNRFLNTLDTEDRNIFMRRYWFGDSVREIAKYTGSGLSKIKMSLLRSRNKLKEMLKKEGYAEV